MKLIAIALTSAGLLAAAGSASAAVSDVEYLKANRCRGLAASGIATVDTASMDATRSALLELMRGLHDTDHVFGTPQEVEPVRHLIGTAAGWGGLPTREAVYVNVAPGLPPGRHTLSVKDVPVDGFWSLSVYNAQGFFEPNDRGAYTVNSVTGVRDADGTITVHLGDWEPGTPNAIPLPEGWNYIVRLYRPHPEIVDGTWSFPSLDT